MSEEQKSYEVGYGKPPKKSRWAKGQSGNVKGRPRGGKKSLALLLDQAGHERVKVTRDGRSRYMTKNEASMVQLSNKAASGDLKAVRELRYWVQAFPELKTNFLVPPAIHVHFIEKGERANSGVEADKESTSPSKRPREKA